MKREDELGQRSDCTDCGLEFWVIANLDAQMVQDGMLVIVYCPRCGEALTNSTARDTIPPT